MPRIAVPILLLLAACAGPRPDLGRLYVAETHRAGQPPVVVIPGLPGSRLIDADNGRETSPGSCRRPLFGRYQDLRLDIDPATLEPRPDRHRPGGMTDRAAGRDFYGRALAVLEEAGGYTRVEPGAAPAGPGPYYYVFMLEPGDGVVTKASLLAREALDPTASRHRCGFFPMRFPFFPCQSHDRLTGNVNFQDNLPHALLNADEPIP